jgi:hypothetical protein
VLATVDGLVGHPGADFGYARRLDDDVHGFRTGGLQRIPGDGGLIRAAVQALDGLAPRLPKGGKGALQVHVRGSHHLHAGYPGDLRDETAAHLTGPDEPYPDGCARPRQGLQFVPKTHAAPFLLV